MLGLNPDEEEETSSNNSSPEQKAKRQKRKSASIIPTNIAEPCSSSISPDDNQRPSRNVLPSWDSIDKVIEQVILEHTASSDSSESEDDSSVNNDNEIIWGAVTGDNKKQFSISEQNPEILTELYNYYDKSPYEFYKMIVNDELFELFVTETNKYAEQEEQKKTKNKSRIKQWKKTDKSEIETFLGIIMFMGLCQFPTISSYWSRNDLYSNKISRYMSRNRFQLLKIWHFSDNENITDDSDRLYKINPLINKFRENCQKAIIPKEYVCIDETLVPFKGRLKFKQYIRNKRHKFGIKLFKLCLEGGYLFDLKVYCGQEKDANENQFVPTKIVLDLTQALVGNGRTICVDYYTSVELAHKLLEVDTYWVH
ncbi:hypothetical protein NQ314_008855 [Rhamnusium bicolor]|uniref:PiggyBac transposable element-derived protein domain-containing protein n=1 Tax=Rhamnusium bicolor TaxID=1586634 RepID=A0AAV8Y7M6_9CUCU|nr:hypothetical protein NQ314_008855 [Rhamnusium bicolor]